MTIRRKLFYSIFTAIPIYIIFTSCSVGSQEINKSPAYPNSNPDSCCINRNDLPDCEQRKISNEMFAFPVYPKPALRKGVESTVKAALRIEPNGFVSEIKILESGGTDFDNAVRVAILRSKFPPLRSNCNSTAANFKKTFRFKMD